jgi:gliding motility-associated-like protein
VINTSGYLAPSANYSISQPALTASITGKALIVTATGPIMTVGTALTTGLSSTNFTASGSISGEAVTSVTLTPNAAGLSASSPSGTTYTVTPSLATGSGGFLASNYIITYNAFTGVVAGPPVVTSINRVSAANTNQSTVNYIVIFDKAVTGVDLSDFQITSTGATTATIASISGSDATYTVVLNTISGDGTIRLDLKSSGTGIQDLEGRAIASGFISGQVYNIDQTRPIFSFVNIRSNNGSIASKAKVGDIITLSLIASESIATPSVTIAGLSATVTGTGGTYTATYTVTSGTSEGLAAISITYSDLAGNAGTVVTSTTNNSTVTVDISNPTISSLLISSSNANAALAKVGDVITISLTASESIATPTVSIAGGTVSMTGSGGTYTATYTVTSSTTQGTVSISVSFADISGNAGTTVTSTTNASSVVVDRTAPTINIASNPANLRSGQTSTLTFTISESVSDFVASDITISGGSIGTLSGTGTTYTAEFTPTANSNANGVIDVAVNKFTDAAGNANTAASNTVTISIDNTLPTVTITASTTALKAGETATITFTFSESVLGFDLSDVTMNNGAFGTLSGTGSMYTATFTPNANVEGTSSISIGATNFTDLAGNDNGVTASLAPLNIDTQVPSIGSSTLSWGASLNNSETGSNGTVTLALTNVENGRTVTVAVNSQTYTATVSSNAATITIPASRLAALTDGGTYTVTTNVSDAAGNAAPAGTVIFTVDKTLPTITSVTTSAGTVINATEAASAATVTVNTTGTENGQVVSVVLNSQTYSATVSSNVATITIPASALTALTDGGTYTVTTNVSDAAANAANQNSFSISVDKTKPMTTISSSTANLNIGQSATLTITLSEVATDFVAGDITIAGGTIGTLSGTGRNYSATFTPSANYEGTASITLASNQFTDPSGNPNDESSNTANTISIAVDTKAPTMTIASNPANLRSGQSATLTFTISEAVSDFVAGDITISGGSIGTLSGTGTTYTAEFTPTANSNANGVIDVAVNKFTDAAGNANTSASNTVTISIDNTVPTVAITSSATALKAGETATITFTFSEAVLGFDLSDVTMNNGTFGTLSGTGSVYTAAFTPNTNVEGTSAISIGTTTFTDLAGNNNAVSASLAPLNIDTKVPSIGSATLSWGTSLNSAETGTNGSVTLALTNVEDGRTVSVSVNSQTYTATVASNAASVSIPASNLAALNNGGTYTVTTNVSDAAGNAAPAGTSTFTVDKTAPTLTAVSVSSDNSPSNLVKSGNTILLSITSSENIAIPTVSIAGQSATVTGTGSTYTATYTVTNNTPQGTASISVTYSDVANNPGTAVTSTTNSSTVVVDTAIPTLGTVSVSSSNTNSSQAKVGDVITVNIVAGEAIQTPRVIVAGQAASVTGTGSTYAATYTVTSNTPQGTASISVTYSDIANNPGTAVISTTNSSTVVVDTAVPILGTVTVSSSNANTSSAKVGDVITVNILAGEAIQTPTITVAGQAATVTGTGSIYAATYTVTSNTPQGTATISVTYSDVANNPGTAVTSTTNSSTVVVDTAVPTLGTVSVSSSNANNSKAKIGDVITVNIVAGEAIQTPTVTVAGQAASVTGTGSTYAATYTVTSNTPQGTASISVTYSDVANNLGTAVTSTTNSSTVLVDKQAPAGYAADWNVTTINNDNFRNVGFTLTNAEQGATYSYTITSGTSSITASGTVTNSTQVIGDINTSTLRDGIITLSLTIIDQAGNSGLAVTDTINKATNGGPTGTPTPITLSQNAPDQTINLLDGITDPEGDPLTISNVTITYSIENVVTNQPVVINSTLLTKFQDVVSTADLTGTNLFIEMSISKFLSGSQKGQINIAYVVTDGNNNLNANAVLNIIGANDQPTGAAVTLNQVVINGQNMGIPLTEGVGVTTNVPGIDPDDDSVIYTLDQNSAVNNGQFVFNPDGSFSFLPDANYYGEQEFDYYIKDQSGVLNGPYQVKIIIAENPDIDGIPSKLEEVAPNGGDVNGDGIPDRKQNNITNVPLGSYADFKAGIDWANGVPGSTRPSTSKVGSLLIGSLPGGKSGLDSLDLDPNAKFRNVALLPTPNIANTDRQFSSDLYQFTIEGLLTNAADTLSPRLPLRDLDPARPGLQVRAVLEFPVGMRGSTYLKQNKAGEWKSFKDDQKLSTYDDGATLIDLDNDPSTIERIVLTFTDGAFGDKDTLVNNSISDPGGLGIIKPVIDDATLLTRAEGVATATALYTVFDRNSRLDVDEEGQKLYYTIDSTNNSAAVRAAVKIDSLTGVITVRDAGGFDYESFVDANGLAQFKIVVKATDTDGNFDLATYTQTITNVDEYPRIISGKTVSYREKQPTTVAVIRVQTLPDYQDLTSFSILPGLDGSFFTVDPATGVLRFKSSPNYDDKPVYTLDIQSQDLSGKTDHAVFTVNIIDIDADNDGILDDEEIGPDPLHPIDTDKDGIPDYLDTDSDGDGIPDLFESKADTDKDGIPDYLDTDSDGDGILDKIEAGPNPLKPLDSDGDGIPDFRELDADNDGYLDSYEKSIDTDKDGIPDFQDTDSDGDGILDKVEDDLDFGNIKDCDHDGIENRIDPDVCDLILPQIITPNGDGLNDVLKIPGILRLQPNHITIINRWGAVVYDAENYQNTWGGTGDSGELPDGTYYYVVDFKGAKPTISNFIYLDRTGK